jgi:hypothetical protein
MKSLPAVLLLSLILLSASMGAEAPWLIDGERFHVSVHGRNFPNPFNLQPD